MSQLLPAILYDPVFLIAIAVFFFAMLYFYWLKRREKEREIEARLKRLEEMQKKEANQNVRANLNELARASNEPEIKYTKAKTEICKTPKVISGDEDGKSSFRQTQNPWMLCFFILFCIVLSSFEVCAQEPVIVLEVADTIVLDKEPFSVAVNEKTNRVYFGVDKGIIVLNGETDKVIEEIPFNDPLKADNYLEDFVFAIDILAVNPETNCIFASGGNHVLIFNGFTNKEVGRIPCPRAEVAFPEKPYCFALNPTTNLVYVADNTVFKDRYDRVIVYDAETGDFVTSVNIPGSNEFEYVQYVGVAVNPVINRIYFTYSVGDRLYVLDGNTNKIIESRAGCCHIPYGTDMVDTIVNPTTNIIYFLDERGTGAGMPIDGESLESIGQHYQGSLRAVDTQNNLLYAVGYTVDSDYIRGSGELFVLNGTTHETLASLELGQDDDTFGTYEYKAAVNSETDKIYLARSSNKTISVIQRTLSFPEEREDGGVNWYFGIIVLVFVIPLLLLFYIVRARSKKYVK